MALLPSLLVWFSMQALLSGALRPSAFLICGSCSRYPGLCWQRYQHRKMVFDPAATIDGIIHIGIFIHIDSAAFNAGAGMRCTGATYGFDNATTITTDAFAANG